MRRMGVVWVVLVAAVAARADFALRSDDRVVFLGDSLTERGVFPEQVERFVLVRYPALHTRFYVVAAEGLTPGMAVEALTGSDATAALLEQKRAERSKQPSGSAEAARLNAEIRDLERAQERIEIIREQFGIIQPPPTRAVVCFGLYETHNEPLPEGRLEAFTEEMRRLVGTLQQMGMQVTVLTPPSADEARNRKLDELDFNETVLGPLAEACRQAAREHHARLVDWFARSVELRRERQKDDPNFAFSRDGIRPTTRGQALGAFELLTAWGAEPLEVDIEVDWNHPESATCSAGQLTATRRDERTLVLDFKDFPMPWVLATGRGERITPDWEALKLCRMTLRVTNFPDLGGLMKTERKSLPIIAEQLEQGMNLAISPILTDARPVRELVQLVATKNRMPRDRARRLQSRPEEPELQPGFEKVLEAFVLYHEGYMRILERTPRTMDLTIELSTLPRLEAPETQPAEEESPEQPAGAGQPKG